MVWPSSIWRNAIAGSRPFLPCCSWRRCARRNHLQDLATDDSFNIGTGWALGNDQGGLQIACYLNGIGAQGATIIGVKLALIAPSNSDAYNFSLSTIDPTTFAPTDVYIWTGVSLSQNGLVSLTTPGTVYLAGGKIYGLHVAITHPTTNTGGWLWNNTGVKDGLVYEYASKPWVNLSNDNSGAFEIDGSPAPEPAPVVALAGGLGLLMLRRRREAN